MIGEADQLEGFLPISYRTAKEYVRFLWEALHAEVHSWVDNEEALAA